MNTFQLLRFWEWFLEKASVCSFRMIGAETFGYVVVHCLIFFKEKLDRVIPLEPCTPSQRCTQECMRRSGCSFPGKVGLLGKSSFGAQCVTSGLGLLARFSNTDYRWQMLNEGSAPLAHGCT